MAYELGNTEKGKHLTYVKSWCKAASQQSYHLPLTTRSVEIVNLIESEKFWLVLQLFLDNVRYGQKFGCF